MTVLFTVINKLKHKQTYYNNNYHYYYSIAVY